ncbi:MAG: hypothetical protein M3N68_11725 [Actinomycetota bacterium]|nr:hypothetical protein [Actinomycetota bacterium]
MKRLLMVFVALGGLLGSLAVGPAGAAEGDYEMPVLFEWDTAVLDVIIVPPVHGQLLNDNGLLGGLGLGELTLSNSYLAAIEQSVAGFDRAVEEFGPDWLKRGLTTNVYVLGRDTIPTEALLEPEVLIVTDETKLAILGAAVTSVRPCIVDNSKLFITSFTFEDMYNINGQEYGHCLGLEHVAGGPPGDEVIAHDTLNGNYADTPGAAGTHRHCVSNLNVKGLELVFSRTLGQGPGGGVARMAPSSYRRIAC